MAKREKPIGLDDVLFVKSDYLKNIRVMLKEWGDLQPMLGGIAQFRIVVDTNVVLGDIMWLSGKRKNADATTCLMEVIEAETIHAYAPPQLIAEVEEKIPLLAKDKGIDENLMQEQWAIYKSKIRIKKPDEARVRELQYGVDPDDAFFIALAEKIAASGVVSKDKHIERMGGNSITIECVASLRDYSRSIAVNMHIKVSGVLLTGVSIAALRGIFDGIVGLYKLIANAPNWVKVSLLLGALFVAFNPKARAAVGDWLKMAMDGIKDATPVVTEQLAAAATLAVKHGDKAEIHLRKAMRELERIK